MVNVGNESKLIDIGICSKDNFIDFGDNKKGNQCGNQTKKKLSSVSGKLVGTCYMKFI